MANPMSTLGIIHTIISLAPVVAGLYSFVKYSAIRPSNNAGRIYMITLVLSVLTSFGLSSTGGFNAGHAIGILALLALAFSLIIGKVGLFGWLTPYLQAFSMSFTFFLLMVPGINETLSRLPPASPIASGPDSPVVQTTLLVWVVVFVAGICLQGWMLRKRPGLAAAA